MDLAKELDKLEDSYYGEWEENKEPLVAALKELHLVARKDESGFNRFLVLTADRFGGAYIPYLFWDKLSDFLSVPEERTFLQQLLKAFVNSGFDEVTQKMMKPLVVVYLAKEKRFELDKIRAIHIDKAHPEVREYFQKLSSFVEKNQKSTEMYCEKFAMLTNIHPDFKLLSMPITQLKERMQKA